MVPPLWFEFGFEFWTLNDFAVYVFGSFWNDAEFTLHTFTILVGCGVDATATVFFDIVIQLFLLFLLFVSFWFHAFVFVHAFLAANYVGFIYTVNFAGLKSWMGTCFATDVAAVFAYDFFVWFTWRRCVTFVRLSIFYLTVIATEIFIFVAIGFATILTGTWWIFD